MIFRNNKDFAVGIVEFYGDIASDFDMLFLIRPTGTSWLSNEDVGRLKNRIGKQTMVGTYTLGDFILVTGASLQKPHRRNTR